jgi:hypothetical protein
MLLEGVGGCEVKWSGPSQGVFLSFFSFVDSRRHDTQAGFLGYILDPQRPANAIKTMWIEVLFLSPFFSFVDSHRHDMQAGFLGYILDPQKACECDQDHVDRSLFFSFLLSLYDYFRNALSTFMYTKSENRNERKKVQVYSY